LPTFVQNTVLGLGIFLLFAANPVSYCLEQLWKPLSGSVNNKAQAAI